MGSASYRMKGILNFYNLFGWHFPSLRRVKKSQKNWNMSLHIWGNISLLNLIKIILRTACKCSPSLPQIEFYEINYFQIIMQDARVFEMMTLAQDMGIDDLKSACEDHVISTLSIANACTFLTAVMEIQEKASGKLSYLRKEKSYIVGCWECDLWNRSSELKENWREHLVLLYFMTDNLDRNKSNMATANNMTAYIK